MWYFAWILGVLFAASFAIINAMWLESVCDIDTHGLDQRGSDHKHTDE